MTDASSRDGDDPASESRPPPRAADAPLAAKDEWLRDADVPVDASGASLRDADVPVDASGASLRDADVPVDASGASLRSVDAPLDAKAPSPRASDDPVRAAGASRADAGAPASEAGGPLATVIPLNRRATQAVVAFLERIKTRNFVASLVRAKVPAADVEDVVHDALEEAVEALKRSPPTREEAVSGWLASITHRTVADYHAKRARRAKYEGPMPVEARDEDDEPSGRRSEPSYDPRAEDADVDGRAFDWLEREVASHPRDRETFEIMLEHYRTRKAYQQIAGERGLSLTAVSQRIFVFKGKYVPRYRRWRRERMLWLLLFGGAALIAASILAIWLLGRSEPVRPDILPLPRPSATATPEPFDPALGPPAPPRRDKP